MDRPIRCSSLTLEREENLITLGENTFYDALLTAYVTHDIVNLKLH
jgi:hypothetical protein